jgi:drug/metabolite transporter (DMT)-like permease
VSETSSLQVQTRPPSSFIEKFATPDVTMSLVTLIWGANFAVVKTALMQIAPLPFTAIRFVAATSLLLLLLRWREGSCTFPPGSLRTFVWLGVAGNTAYQALFASGLACTTSANASLIVTTTPAAIALIGALVGVEQVTRRVVAGIALAFGGVAVVMGTRGAALSSQTLAGDLMIFGSVFCWTAYVLGIRTVGAGISSLRATTLTLITGTPGLVLLGLPGLIEADWTRLGGATVFGLLYSSALALVVCYLLYNRNVRLIGGVRTTIYGCAIPVVAALIAWPALGERPTLLQGAGAVLIIAGVLVTRRK